MAVVQKNFLYLNVSSTLRINVLVARVLMHMALKRVQWKVELKKLTPY